MTIVTPVDGQPAIAEHVAQLTETLTGVRAEPLTLTGQSLFRQPVAQRNVGNTTSGRLLQYYSAVELTNNASLSGTTWNRDDVTRVAARLQIEGAVLRFSTAPSGANPAGSWTDVMEAVQGRLKAYGDLEGYNVYADGDIDAGGSLSANGTAYLSDVLTYGYVSPGSTNAYDLGATGARWRKLYATDADFTNTPTVGGVALPTASHTHSYLPLAGGTLAGHLMFSPHQTYDIGAENTPYNRPRAIYVGNGGVYVGGTSTAAIVVGAIPATGPYVAGQQFGGMQFGDGFNGVLWRINASGYAFVPGANNSYDVGDTSNRVRKLYATDADLAGGLVTGGNAGVGVAPGAWSASYRVLQVGQAGALWADAAAIGTTRLTHNSYYDGTNDRALVAGRSARIVVGEQVIRFDRATTASAGATQAFFTSAQIDLNGKLLLTPASTIAGLNIRGVDQPAITVSATAPSSPIVGDLWVW
jgi:hypothetical protein